MQEVKEEAKQKSAVERAEEVNAKLEINLAALRSENERLENLKAERILGGGTPAGQTPEKKPEVTPVEYAMRALKGRV